MTTAREFIYRTATIDRVPPDRPDATPDTLSTRPVRADATAAATAGGVLVTTVLHNDTAVDVRVRVANDLDGPVLPPRREGVPAAGWDADGFTGVVPAESRLGIGYACPCPSESPERRDPVSVEVLGPADEAVASTPDRVAAAVRSLGRATPPADAVPDPTPRPAPPPAASDTSAANPEARRRDRLPGSRPDAADLPAPVGAWLDTVEERIARASRLTDATAGEAAAILDACGGVDAVSSLPADLKRDLTALRAAADRIEALSARADGVEPAPVVSALTAAAGGDAPASGPDGSDSTPAPDSAPDAEGRPRGGTR